MSYIDVSRGPFSCVEAAAMAFPRILFPLASWALGALLLAEARLCAAQSPPQWAAARTMMVEAEVAAAGVKDPAILAVMRSVPRHEFVPADVRQYAYFDMA